MNFKVSFAHALAVTALLLGSVSAGQAWHATGHMMTAAVAWDQMTPAARKRVAELLKKNPDFDTWVQGVQDADKDKTAFVQASIWPDVIKRRTPEYTDDGEDPNDPNADANVGYSDKLMHKYWHTIDLTFILQKQTVKLFRPTNQHTE